MTSLIICFSPTKGSEKIARAIQKGMDGEDHDRPLLINLTKNDAEGMPPIADGVPVIFAIPVYRGRMPEIAKKRFDKICSKNNNPAILVATYGNRAFENALADLEEFVREHGFNPIAAGAFIGEHSYSTRQNPIAAGRPDFDDIKAAEEFGRLARKKILEKRTNSISASELKDEPSPESSIANFKAFGKARTANQQTSSKKPEPERDESLCTGCGMCASVCPSGSIKDDLSIDPAACIACCACVKACPEKAMSYKTPYSKMLSENFSMRKSPHWIL